MRCTPNTISSALAAVANQITHYVTLLSDKQKASPKTTSPRALPSPDPHNNVSDFIPTPLSRKSATEISHG